MGDCEEKSDSRTKIGGCGQRLMQRIWSSDRSEKSMQEDQGRCVLEKKKDKRLNAGRLGLAWRNKDCRKSMENAGR